MLDSVAFPKQGNHSVGVARQTCDGLDKPDNCQVAVSLRVGNEHASLPIAYQLYLPKAWVEDPARSGKAGVPKGVEYETRAAIALRQLRQAIASGTPPGIVLGGVEYGGEVSFRSGVSGLGLTYALAVLPSTGLWSRAGHEAAPAKALALSLSSRTWRQVAWWGEGRAKSPSRFAAQRVRPAHSDLGTAPGEEWLLVEWPLGSAEPARYWLSNLSPHIALKSLVRTVKQRCRAERDLRELRRDAGLGHYEGRGWRGFHHHASLCITTHGFLVAERCSFPPSQRLAPGRIVVPERPRDFLPRGFSPRPGVSDCSQRGSSRGLLETEDR